MKLDEAWLQRQGYILVGDLAIRPLDWTAAPPAAPTPVLRPPLPSQAEPIYRSKTEARYAMLLNERQAEGMITRWWYEPCSLRLGVRCHYIPDFLVERPGTAVLEYVEVKGAWVYDRAMIKPKVAATRFPCFVFTLAVWDRHVWTESCIRAHDERSR